MTTFFPSDKKITKVALLVILNLCQLFELVIELKLAKKATLQMSQANQQAILNATRSITRIQQADEENY